MSRDEIHRAFLEGEEAIVELVTGVGKTHANSSKPPASDGYARPRLRGYLSTARQQAVNVFAAIRDALTGEPWMPPRPDCPVTVAGFTIPS